MSGFPDREITLWRLEHSPHVEKITLIGPESSRLTMFDGRRKFSDTQDHVVPGVLSGDHTDWVFLEAGILVVRTKLLNQCESLSLCLLNDIEPFGIVAGTEAFEAMHPVGIRPAGTRGPCKIKDAYYMPAFRISGQSPLELFTTSGYECHPEDDLKAICEEHGLKGLEFREFWRGPIEDLV